MGGTEGRVNIVRGLFVDTLKIPLNVGLLVASLVGTEDLVGLDVFDQVVLEADVRQGIGVEGTEVHVEVANGGVSSDLASTDVADQVGKLAHVDVTLDLGGGGLELDQVFSRDDIRGVSVQQRHSREGVSEHAGDHQKFGQHCEKRKE